MKTEDTIKLIMEDEKKRKFYKRFGRFTSNWAITSDFEGVFPSKEASFEIEQLYRMFLTPNELKKVF